MDKLAARETFATIREVIKDNIHSNTGSIYTPGSEAGRFFAKLATDIPVTRELIEQGKLPLDPIDKSLAALALSDFLRSCVNPIEDLRKDHTFTNPSPRQPRKRLNTCSSAEEYFSALFDTIESTVDGRLKTPYPDWTIVVDNDSAPIAIQKHKGVLSTLSLTPITIEGCIIPAGSLLDTGFSYDNEEFILPRAAGIVSPVSSVETVDFLRLSQFAYRPENGADVHYTQVTEEVSYPLRDYIELAEKCIPLCAHIGDERDRQTATSQV